MPLSDLKDRMMCPQCGGRRISIIFDSKPTFERRSCRTIRCAIFILRPKGQAAIRGLFRVQRDRAGNLSSFPAICPDQMGSHHPQC
jgi:hypothetical protein